MQAKLISLLESYRRLAGINLHIAPDGRIRLHIVVVERKDKRLTIVHAEKDPVDFNALTACLKPGTPVAISLNGKGVIIKKVENESNDLDETFKKVFPGTDAQQFVYESIPCFNGQILFVARRELIDQVVERLSSAGLPVVYAGIGFSTLPFLFNLSATLPETVDAGLWQITRDGATVLNFREIPYPVSSDFHINGVRLMADQLLAFSVSLPAFLHTSIPLQHAKSVQLSLQNYRMGQFFRLAGMGFLGLMLITLFFNVYLFIQLDAKVARQQIVLDTYQEQIAQVDGLKKQIEKRSTVLNQHPARQPSCISKYADQLGTSLPIEIRLTSLSVFPREKVANLDAGMKFISDKIRVEGISKQSVFLNEWIRRLERLDWVSTVEVLPYSENQTGQGTFELVITLK